MALAIGTTKLPLPGGERIEVRGLCGCEHSRLSNPLTLPSPPRGEGPEGGEGYSVRLREISSAWRIASRTPSVSARTSLFQ